MKEKHDLSAKRERERERGGRGRERGERERGGNKVKTPEAMLAETFKEVKHFLRRSQLSFETIGSKIIWLVEKSLGENLFPNLKKII